ncbi:MAG TPA: response regulator [Bryobacteraceae bacterium]|nr:response regulator [Bryobacteraceae bacterium]
MSRFGPAGVADSAPGSLPAREDDQRHLQAQFLASVNHEFRTPLSGILGMAELLLETDLTDEQREYLDAIRLCADNLVALLNRVLDYCELAEGTLLLEEAEFDLPGELAAAAEPFRERAAAKGLSFECDLDPALPKMATGDPVRLRQVLTQLLDNALKFTHRGGIGLRARVAWRRRQRAGVEISVRDTGIGIPEDKLQCVFDAFGALDSGFRRGYAGLGLGLAIAGKLVRLMGGTIRVDSRVGQGSVFTAEIPLLVREQDSLADATESAAQPAGPRILVVEDDPVAQRIVARVLERRSYSVTCAASGIEALQLAAAARFDLVLLDLQMPEMDGVETAVRLRRMTGYEKTPLVAVTANATEEYRRRCAAAGMQAFLTKPVSGAELLATVEGFLR